MKIHYYNDTDSLYIELSSNPSYESREVSKGLIVDFDSEGLVVGFDIEDASKNFKIDELETISLPAKIVKK